MGTYVWSIIFNKRLRIKSFVICILFIFSYNSAIGQPTYCIPTYTVGTSYGEEYSFTTSQLCIGDLYKGGVVAYIFSQNDPGFVLNETHGLILSVKFLGNSVWGCEEISINTSAEIGQGLSNTNNIVSKCPTSGIAARLCYDCSYNGYYDWFLPSRDELKVIIQNNDLIGGYISNKSAWSSTQTNAIFNAWVNDCNGDEYGSSKVNYHLVIPVRYF